MEFLRAAALIAATMTVGLPVSSPCTRTRSCPDFAGPTTGPSSARSSQSTSDCQSPISVGLPQCSGVRGSRGGAITRLGRPIDPAVDRGRAPALSGQLRDHHSGHRAVERRHQGGRSAGSHYRSRRCTQAVQQVEMDPLESRRRFADHGCVRMPRVGPAALRPRYGNRRTITVAVSRQTPEACRSGTAPALLERVAWPLDRPPCLAAAGLARRICSRRLPTTAKNTSSRRPPPTPCSAGNDSKRTAGNRPAAAHEPRGNSPAECPLIISPRKTSRRLIRARYQTGHARETARSVRGRRRWRGRMPTGLRDREQLRAIREWAKQAGLNVADRGRIPRLVLRETRKRLLL
jgi:hypothetical protein